MMGRMLAGLALALGVAAAFGAGAVSSGADSQDRPAPIYEQNCSPCHGSRMRDPNAAFDLRTFPHDQKDRFFASVTKGKNQMPPWGDLFKPDEIEALWAYVMAGER